MTGQYKKISDLIGKSIEELQKEESEIFAEFQKAIFPDVKELSEEQTTYIKGMSFNKMRSSYRKELSVKSIPIENVVFFGVSETRDMIARKRAETLKEYEKNPSLAIKNKMVLIEDNKVIPLVWSPKEEVEKMVGAMSWKKDNLGKPMPETQIEKYANGLIKVGNKWIEIFFKIRGENTKVVIPEFSIVDFRGFKTQASTDLLYKVNDAGKLNFEIKKKLTEEEIKEILTTTLKSRNMPLNSIKEVVTANESRIGSGRVKWGYYAITKAVVTEIVPETVTKTGKPLQMIRVEDDSLSFTDAEGNIIPPITCFMPSHIAINFPEGSLIYIIGQPAVNERGNSIGVLGIYVPEFCRNSVPKKVDLEGKEESIPQIPANKADEPVSPVDEEEWE